MNRRSLIALLIGVIASLVGLMAAVRLRQGKCVDAGGAWDAARRACTLPAGIPAEPVAGAVRDYGLGVVIAVFAGFLLWRVYLLATGAGPRRRG